MQPSKSYGDSTLAALDDEQRPARFWHTLSSEELTFTIQQRVSLCTQLQARGVRCKRGGPHAYMFSLLQHPPLLVTDRLVFMTEAGT